MKTLALACLLGILALALVAIAFSQAAWVICARYEENERRKL